MSEIQAALERPIVRRVIDLVRLRNIHPAFDGELDVEADDEHSIRLRWRSDADVVCLDVDFAGGSAVLTDGRRVLLSDGPPSRSLASWVPPLPTAP